MNPVKLNLLLTFCMICTLHINAQTIKGDAGGNFEEYFTPKTLRIDFELGGNATTTMVFFKEMKEEPFWGGPVKNLTDPFSYGNFRYRVYDANSNKLLYEKGFGSLFEEWKATEEAKSLNRTFYQVATMPFPKNKIRFEIDERGYATGNFSTIFSREIDPTNYFILKEQTRSCKTMHLAGKGKSSESLDIAVIAEGYTAKEMKKFRADVLRVMGYITDMPPYNKYKSRINIYAVESVSQQSGPDIPGEQVYSNTPLNTSYYTFDVSRYLTTTDYKSICDYAANVPYDQIFVLINSKRYGGGGFYNFYTGCTSDNELTPKVSIHEFGHGFGGLADEYYESEMATSDFYNLQVEPWEPNITTNIEFERKWSDLVQEGIPMPTPRTAEFTGKIGMFEGGGYVSKGVYSPTMDCNMKSNTPDDPCPVCQLALELRLKFIMDQKVDLL